MPCPTCSHTMAALERLPSSMTWLCDRCGTVKRSYTSGAPDDVYVPKLVERCREFERLSPALLHAEGAFWHSLGIAESIRPQEERTP